MKKKILFIRLRLLGDIVFTMPAIQLYKKNHPESEIYYLVEERFREVAEIIPGINKIITVPDRMGIKEIIRFRKNIKKSGIQTVIDFHSGPRSALLTFLSGAKSRIGYRTPNRNWAYNRLVPRKLENLNAHSVANQARLLTPLGIDTQEIPAYPEIEISSENVSDEIAKIVELKNKVVIHIGAKKRYRDWGIENFSSLIKLLREDNYNIFLIGKGEEEEKRSRYLKDLFNIHDFTGKLSVREILFVIAHSDVYFGADSGPLHLASLTHTPIVALYGPNIPEISGPFRNEKVTIIQLDLDCIPCHQKSCKFDEVKCMTGIDVSEVYQAIKKY
ncbi:MAG: glycosyltransferase family 9 protein [Candidatus Aminicenantes bacterium]|nr:MAG: glycosyltransferase family 9 protein [Candidatus Aminicenantes bacterium]